MSENEIEVVKPKMLPAKPGCCSVCAVDHRPDEAHNWTSLFYQMHFYNRYGRNATLADAVAHLSEDDQELWRKVAVEHGVEWTEPESGDPIAEPYATN